MSEAPRPDLAASLLRSAGVLAAIAVLVPLGLHFLFERQAHRLEALADHGVPTSATVTGFTGAGTLHYAYSVDGTLHEWEVRRELVAGAGPGGTLEVYYLPEDPGMTRPDRSAAGLEATSNRSFVWKLLLGIFWFFGGFAVTTLVELREVRRLGEAVYRDPVSHPAILRRRLASMGVLLAPLLLGIFAFHAADGAARGESMIPVVLGAILSLAILGGTVTYALRNGPAEASARARRLARWAVPLALALAVVRFVMTLFEP